MQNERTARTRRTKVKKRSGLYFRTGPDGRRTYELTYKDSDGKRRWKSLPGLSLEEAQNELDSIKSQMRSGQRVAPSNLTVATLVTHWLNEQTSGLRPATVRRYEAGLRLHVIPNLGDVKATDLNEDHVAALIAKMGRTGAADWTIRSTLTPLSRALSWAARRGHIGNNVVQRLERSERPGTSRREMRLLDSTQLAALLAGAEGVYKVMLATAAFTGVRVSELLGLRWEDVDFDRGRVNVRWQVDDAGKR